MSRPRKGQRRRKASPLGRSLSGIRRRVCLSLKFIPSSDGWIEVQVLGRNERFFVAYTHQIGDVVRAINEGGYWVEVMEPKTRKLKHT